MENRRCRRTFKIGHMSFEEPMFINIEGPFRYRKEWCFGCNYRVKNRTALAIARFIARFNGYRLVKEPKEV